MVSLLAGHAVNLTFIKGISGVLMGDLTASNDIKVLARQLELDGQLIINILDLTNKKTEQLPQIIYDLFSKDQSDQILTLTSLIYAIKKDVTNVKPIANKLGVDANLLIPVLAAAVGKTSILVNFYQSLATKFHIQNHYSVKYSIELSKGQTSCISELQKKKSKLFYIPEPELFESIIYLLDSGSQIYGQKNAANSLALKLDGSLAHLYKKLKKAFTFDTTNKGLFPKGTSKRLNEALHLLFNACWGDYQSIQILYKRLRGKEMVESDDNIEKKPVKSIWIKKNPHLNKFKEDKDFTQNYHLFQKISKPSTQKLMRIKFQQITDDFDLIQSQIKELQCTMINILKTKILPEINKRYQNKEFKEPRISQKQAQHIREQHISKEGGNNLLQEIIQRSVLERAHLESYSLLYFDIDSFTRSKEAKFQLQTGYKDVQLYEAAFKNGCTFGITLFKKLRQPFFYCIDCNGELDDDTLGICIICALICHNGHKLKPGNYGIFTKIICDCGSGKFNECKNFLSNNPLERIEDATKDKQSDIKQCAALRKHFRKGQEDLWAQNKLEKEAKINDKENKPDNIAKTDQQKIDEVLQYYTNEMFLIDIARAIDLPDYFANKDIFRTIFTGDDLSATMFSLDNELIELKDELIGRNISLIENLILLSSGRSTDSFVTLLTSKNQYRYEHYQNQLIYNKVSKNGKVSKTLGTYNALSCFIAMLQGDNQRFQRYGQGYVDALGESGSKEVTAKDKICNILRISNGGKLPQYQQFAKTDKSKKAPKINTNGYLTTFQKLFGVHGVKVIALHKLLTLKKGDLIKISSSTDEQDFKDHPELKNVQDWINNNLYENYLQLESKNIEWIKTIIRLCCQDMDAFNFIVQEQKIPPLNASMYKAMLTGNKYDLQPIFEKLKTFIPYGLNKFLNQVWSFDRKAIINFIFKYAEVDSKIQKSWKEMEFKKEVEGVEDYKHKKNYLLNLFSMMSGETLLLGEKMASLICHLTKKDIEFEETFVDPRTKKTLEYAKCNMSDFQSLFKPDKFIEKEPNIYRLIYSLISIHGIFTDNVLEIPQIVRYFDKERKLIKEGEALSLVSLCNKCWNQTDVEFILRKLMGDSDGKLEISSGFFELAKQILQASEGELESIGRVSDEVFATDNCHIRSLLVSCITGNTKFDYLDDLPESKRLTIDIKGRRNLLKREMYYIYEKATRFAFIQLMKDQQESIAFLNYSFNQKIPLHLFSILSENFNMVCKLFSPNVEFCDNLNQKFKDNTTDAEQQKYLSIFLDFLDPFTLTSNIKPILRKVLKLQVDEKLFINVQKLNEKLVVFDMFEGIKFKDLKVDSDSNLIKNLYEELHVTINEDSIDIEMIALVELVMQCFQGDKKAFVSLSNVFSKLFEKVHVLAHLFNLCSKLLQGKKNKIFDDLPAVVAIIIMLYKKQLIRDQQIDDKDKQLIESVVSWMEAIMIMLDKENNFDSETIRQKLQTMVNATLDYFGDREDHCFRDHYQNAAFLVDVIQGIMNLAKGNFQEMERMAMKIGGFPSVDKLVEFFKITGKHSEMLDFGATQAADKKDDKDEDSEQKTFDAKGLFEYFSKSNNGYIGIEEFRNVCKNLGVKGGSRQLMIFAKVDTKHTGNLNFYQFSKAITQIQLLVVEETIEQMGLSINDLVLEFVWAMVMLLMLFIFIFIGIMAFAPVTSFSSVLNSSLLAGSGGFVNSKKDDQEENNGSEEATANAAGDIIGGSS